jgi:hypothetical protein
MISVCVTIPASDVDRLQAGVGPLVLDWDVIEEPDRRSLCISYVAAGANAYDVTRRLDKAGVLYRQDGPPDTLRLCDCTGEFCTVNDDIRRTLIEVCA